MSDKREERRERLRQSLELAGHKRIGESGLAALRARDLAQDVGCAVGAIYNAFDDLDALILAVNQRTLVSLNDALEKGEARNPSSDAADRLVALAHAYCDFATVHPNHWRAVFEHRLPEGRSLPAPFGEALEALFRHITEPLAALMPRASDEALALRSRTLFAAVHGIVALWLEGRFGDAGAETIHDELAALVRAYAEGV